MQRTDASAGGPAPVRRRPSGEPPPLPRPHWWRWIVGLLSATLVLGAVLTALAATSPPDASLLRAVADPGGAPGLATTLARLAEPSAILLLRAVLVVTLLAYGRLRHLLVAVLAMWFVDVAVGLLGVGLPDPGIAGATPPGDGYLFPSPAMSSLAVTVAVLAMALVPAGAGRRVALAGGVTLCVLVGAASVVLGAAYPTAAGYATLLAFATALATFGWLAPDDAFPVHYRRGEISAHLDLEGPRREAVIRAVGEQLGLTASDVRPFGAEGSGGSTPLLLTLEDGRRLFGKILATNHVRSDRWYRVVRTIMYGRLEDETAFASVRRLVAYEDYALRLLDDVGVRVAHPYGIVELTPDREYLLVTEFFEGAQTLGHADVDGAIVDQGVDLVRTLWDAGLAHRDIKPANLLVVDGRLQLIDVSVLEVRPSPWRQAVDLANMLLVLGLRHDAEDVYRRALGRFAPQELAEAFAAARGMAIPTELQRHLAERAPDLLDRYRSMAPPHPPISMQRWSARRAGLAVAVAGGGLALAAWSVATIRNV